MNCHTHRDAILDLARGVAMSAAVLDAMQAHLQRCPACASELRRQKRLTTGLRELADEARSWTVPAGLEERLLAAFADPPAAGAAAHEGRAFPWWTLAAAAVVVLVSWLAVRAVRNEPPATQAERTDVGPPPRTAAAAPRPAAERSAIAQSMATRVAGEPAAAKRAAASRARPARPQSARSVEFMAIPGAAGLPALESATIIRTELPISALPTYGVTISPDARRAAVEADLLVGQDGQARAIRLVTAQHDPETSRSGQ